MRTSPLIRKGIFVVRKNEARVPGLEIRLQARTSAAGTLPGFKHFLWIKMCAIGCARVQVLDLAQQYLLAEECSSNAGLEGLARAVISPQFLWTKL